MIETITITQTGPTPGMMKSVWNPIAKETWSDVGAEWHDKYHDEHFEPTAFERYPGVYVKRKGTNIPVGSARYKRSYVGRKMKAKGHNNPLEFSGRSRQLVKIARITSTARAGARVIMNAPALNFAPQKSRINMRLEMTAINQQEAGTLSRFGERRLHQRLNGNHVQKIERL